MDIRTTYSLINWISKLLFDLSLSWRWDVQEVAFCRWRRSDASNAVKSVFLSAGVAYRPTGLIPRNSSGIRGIPVTPTPVQLSIYPVSHKK